MGNTAPPRHPLPDVITRWPDVPIDCTVSIALLSWGLNQANAFSLDQWRLPLGSSGKLWKILMPGTLPRDSSLIGVGSTHGSLQKIPSFLMRSPG